MARLRGVNAEYSELLKTEKGQAFVNDMGSERLTKEFAEYLSRPDSEAYSINNPRSRRDITDPDPYLHAQDVYCIQSDNEDAASATLQRKMDVLNCVIFRSRYEFWKYYYDDLLKRDRGWLYSDDDKCTKFFDGPVPSCYRHDVAFGTLQRMIGGSSEDPGKDVDAAWNPRNKHLADDVFKEDIAKHGCDSASGLGQFSCTIIATNLVKSHVFIWGTRWINSKGWPVTSHDLAHTGKSNEFVPCDIPKVNNVKLRREGRNFIASWIYKKGFVNEITVDQFKLSWISSYSIGKAPVIEHQKIAGDQNSDTFRVPSSMIDSLQYVKISSIGHKT